MTKYNFISLILICSCVIYLGSCDRGTKNPAGTKEVEVLPADIVEMRADQIKLANIETGSIQIQPIRGRLKVSGVVSVAPQNHATICMPLGGFVKTTSLMPGNAVRKGQTLAILENQEFIDMQQNYLETKNKFELAEADFKRHSELYKNDVYSAQNLQQVTSDYRNLKAHLKAMDQKLALIGINASDLNEDKISRSVAVISPISGFVKTVNVNIGKFVAPSDVMFEIVNSDKLFLELTLFEKDADKVHSGQNILFFINNEAEKHEAVICQTGKSISTDKTYKVYATVPGFCKNVLPGMYVNALIETSGNKVTVLPSDAVVSFDDKDYIFVFEKSKEEAGKPFTEYRMVEIHKGLTDSGFTEVILPDNFDIHTSRVVIKGAYNLLSAKKNAGEMSC
jgi:cobalt-zinc-cadmium efflux system membrane fusion protein